MKAQVVKSKAATHPVEAVTKPVKSSKTLAPTKAAVGHSKDTPPVLPATKPSVPKKNIKPTPNSAPQADTKPHVKPDATKKTTAKPIPVPVPKPDLHQTKKKPETVTTHTPITPKIIEAQAAAKPTTKVAGPELQMTPSGVPVRTGRPSSRLAQLTVPSMAQSVASTAAKSSFTQITAAQPIVPPLASATKRDPKLANNWKSKPVTELTDAEIIAMPDDVYMNDTQLSYFRLKLVTLKNDILSSAGETTEHLREDTVVVPDPADRATIEEEHALELRTRDRERKLLKKIEQSIGRIDAGDYGYCDETGEPIGVGRLLARPTATLSLEAQQRRELKQKMFGD